MARYWHTTWKELRRRKVIRAGAAYAVAAWIVLQLAEVVYEPLGLPAWALTWTVLAVILGFPLVAILAWFFDATASGLRRDRGAAGAAGPFFAVAVVVATVAALGWWLASVYEPVDGAPQPGASTADADVPANSIAVLPFEDMSPERRLAHFADGVSEELLDALAARPGLQVAARTASFAHRGVAPDMRVLGASLRVRWLVEGSVREADGQVRITGQLIDARDGYHAWSDTYDYDASAPLEVQADVAREMGRAIEERLAALRREGSDRVASSNPAALSAHQAARTALALQTPQSLAEAEAGFRRATELDPQFARAWSGLADTLLYQIRLGTRAAGDAIAQAEAAAVRAITLDPEAGECWASIGLLRASAGQLDAARRSLEQALRREPQLHRARLWLADVQQRLGAGDEALALLELATTAQPLDAESAVAHAVALARGGRSEEGRARLLDLLAIRPADGVLLRGLARLEAGIGRLAEALAAAGEASAAEPTSQENALLLARLLMLGGQHDRARRALAEMPAASPQRVLLAQEIALRDDVPATTAEFAELLAGLPESSTLELAQQARELAGTALLLAGDAASAREVLEIATGDVERIPPTVAGLTSATLLHRAQALQGTPSPALRTAIDAAVEELLAVSGDSAEALHLAAAWDAQRGEHARAMVRVDAAIAAGFRDRWWLQADPRLASLREGPQAAAFAASLARMPSSPGRG